MKSIIWIIGALSSGKTSLNKGIIEIVGDGRREYFSGEENGVNYSFTRFGDICSLGDINASQCCGLDRVSSRLKNAGVELSLKKAFEKSDFVIVESIMSASTWFDFLEKNCDNLFLVHIYCSFEENVRRLKKRQFSKENKGENPTSEQYLKHVLSDANYEFIRKTRLQYKGIYSKFNNKCFSLEIDTTRTGEYLCSKQVVKFIGDKIDANT